MLVLDTFTGAVIRSCILQNAKVADYLLFYSLIAEILPNSNMTSQGPAKEELATVPSLTDSDVSSGESESDSKSDSEDEETENEQEVDDTLQDNEEEEQEVSFKDKTSSN